MKTLAGRLRGLPGARRIHLALIVAIAVAAAGSAGESKAQALAAGCVDGPQPSGAIYRICMPTTWNGDLVVYAHGFVAPQEPVAIPEDHLTLPDGTNLPQLVNGLNFAFVTSSYRKNGLAILEGIQDLREAVQIFTAQHGAPDKIYLTGVSEGGLVTALGVERYPETFDGGLAACGPIGDFQGQINYMGDARVLFDYFFPGAIQGSPVNVPQAVIDNWDNYVAPLARAAMIAQPAKTQQIVQVARIPVDPAGGVAASADAIVGLLWYNVHATGDAIAQLGGQPFDNQGRIYSGSANDAALNAGVQRFAANPTAAATIQANYQTSANLTSPLVVIHTTGDEVVPVAHVIAYGKKAFQAGSGNRLVSYPFNHYGHCNFNALEVLLSFFVLMAKVDEFGP